MQSVTFEQIYTFLKIVAPDFPVHLSDKVDLVEYAHKLSNLATIVATMDGDTITSAVFGYTENLIDNSSYVALVATLKEYRKRGLSKECWQKFITICKEKNIDSIHLYTDVRNIGAQKMYENLGFIRIPPCAEREEDIHYLLDLCTEYSRKDKFEK